MRPLTNKTIVITGAAGGLGKALASELLRQGCHLALVDINAPALEQTQNELHNNNRLVTTYVTDIADAEQVKKTRDAIIRDHAKIDMLINNAGVSISLAFDQLDLSDYHRLMDINFWGTVYCTRFFMPSLTGQPAAAIINVISDFALMGFPGKTAYCSSKSAIMGFTNALKTELAGTAVRVSLVIPPPLDTGLVKTGQHSSEEKRNREAAFLQRHGMPVDKAAKKIVQKIARGKYRIVTGSMMFFVDACSRLFPTLLHSFIGSNKQRIDFV